jgi:hypothetical protein
MTYRLFINKRNYSSWSWIHTETRDKLPEEDLKHFPQPISQQLFHEDQYCSDTQEIIRCSPLRTEKAILGTLVLEGNRSYGRQMVNNKSGRLYYRCIPKSIHYPVFLLPYKPVVEFAKINVNFFVVFQYKEWKERTAPYGGLVETIGAVNHLPSYYRYLLISNCLEFHPNQWIPIPKNPTVNMEKGDQPRKSNQKKGEPFVFSIDPNESRDLDDAFSFQWNRGSGVAVVNIYIADVVFWIDALNAWDALRMENLGCTTIYLPDQNHPLLPRWLSDKKGSLLEGEMRPVMELELTYRKAVGSGKWVLEKGEFHRSTVKIHKNFRYDTLELETCPEYQAFLDFTRGCRIFGDTVVRDSHDLVEVWMIEYNIFAGSRLSETGRGGGGILRKTLDLETETDNTDWSGLQKNRKFTGACQFLKHYKKTRGEYILFGGLATDCHHTKIREGDRVLYAHASSPLRRMVDIYNQLCIALTLGMIETEKHLEFKHRMESSVEEINAQNRIIRRIQNECEMLANFFSDEVGASEIYDGVVMDLEIRKKGEVMETKGYWVFLEKWKRMVYVEKQDGDTEIRERGQIGKYQIFLFEEEEKAHKKVICRAV